MKGDSIVIEPHHRAAAKSIDRWLAGKGLPGPQRMVVTVAGESGSGKSETAAALADVVAERNIRSLIFQQDDYFALPPRRNDRARREDIGWVGPQEVHLDLLNRHLEAFKRGETGLEKPLVDYGLDLVGSEQLELGGYQLAIAEGTYTSLLASADVRVFIDRDWQATRAHRERRRRDASELDPFIDQVLAIEHQIISGHRQQADLVITDDFRVREN